MGAWVHVCMCAWVHVCMCACFRTGAGVRAWRGRATARATDVVTGTCGHLGGVRDGLGEQFVTHETRGHANPRSRLHCRDVPRADQRAANAFVCVGSGFPRSRVVAACTVPATVSGGPDARRCGRSVCDFSRSGTDSSPVRVNSTLAGVEGGPRAPAHCADQRAVGGAASPKREAPAGPTQAPVRVPQLVRPRSYLSSLPPLTL